MAIGRRIAAGLIAVAAWFGMAASHAAPSPESPFELRSVGAPELSGLMDALFAEFARNHPSFRMGRPWNHDSDARAIGALMFELADIAPMIRVFDRNELAPYDHQFRGDMMRSPMMIAIGRRGESPVWIALNRRPGAPIHSTARVFLEFVLSPEGQQLIARQPGFAALSPADLERERSAIGGFVARLDPRLPDYRLRETVSGTISSVGSDGMKSLMERWMDGYSRHHPRVARGRRWEHLGTLNGFHALLNGEADLAPMGRELWPQEQSAYKAATGLERPLEVRVARGGFNTPQRTTAQAIFVNAANPVAQITLPQLHAIFGAKPTITRWGQLGLGGEWADRPIRTYMPPAMAPNAMSMQIGALQGDAWSPGARTGTVEETASRLAGDAEGIGFGGFEEGGPGLKALVVAAADGAEAVTADYETVSSGRYPLTRYMYIRLTRRPGQALPRQVREFLRYILSREGQVPVPFSGYFPLSADEAAAELAKLDRL